MTAAAPADGTANSREGKNDMVEVNYINGDTEMIETVQNNTYDGHFTYDIDEQCFVIFDHVDYYDCMRVPVEFVKNIRYIEV